VIALMIAAAISMATSLVGTRLTIGFFRSRGKGQPILGKEDRGPEHQHKAGTPTMGGIAIVGAAALGYLVAHAREGMVFSRQALVLFGAVLVMAFLGFLDDFIKVRISRNRGIFWKKKGYITFVISVALAWILEATTDISTTISFTRADSPGWELPWWLWILWAGAIIFATTNAVNVTDGLDGLAAGSALFGFLAFAVIAYFAFRNGDLSSYDAVINPLDLGVVGVAFAGACGGFLWYNAAPARIFMGDVGALGIGAALALLALTTNTHLLLPLICGINVMEIGSVAIQMGVFKATKRSGKPKRVFKISPIHHHFEFSGWPETTVIIRFWLIAGISVAIALAIFVADFTRLREQAGR
jgi:phospho-N-acetylmuramoyl-pentapeptide-transferase